VLCATMAAVVGCATGCGGVAVHAASDGQTATLQAGAQDGLPPPPAEAPTVASAGASRQQSGGGPAGPGVTPNPAQAAPMTTGARSDEQAITGAFHAFAYVLSGLDDNLNSSWLPPLTEVTTERLAQAVARQASAILNAHEHGIGALAGRNLTVRFTGATTAAVADCEDYQDFYLVDDGTQAPDSGVVRGYFVGTAQLIKIAGRWYVDVYATTQTACDWARLR
jgi:hypothetical protein